MGNFKISKQMRVTRFCSKDEYDSFISGRRLCNDRRAREDRGFNSTAVGFCFTEEAPDIAFQHLKGIVDHEVCMTLEFPDGHLTESEGVYCEPPFYDEAILTTKKEWCCVWYDKFTAKLISADFHYTELAPSRRQLLSIFNL